MKKIFLPIFVIAFGLCGVLASTPLSSIVKAEELPSIQEINDENDFFDIIKNTSEENSTKNTNEKTKLNLKLTDDLDFAEYDDLIFKDFSFYGVLDGNGYTISNLKISSSTSNYGLFAEAKDCEIKNLRLGGTATFIFADGSDANVGLLIGKGSNVTVECCEFDVTYQTQNEDEQSGIMSDLSMNLGNVAGYLESSLITDCINYSNAKLELNNAQNAIGGFVGSMNMGAIKYAINYGDLEYVNHTQQTSQTNEGGLIGYLAGVVDIKNCAAMGEFKASVQTIVGSLIGKLSFLDNFDQNGSNFGFCYYTSDINPIGSSNGFVLPSDCKHIEIISIDFFEDAENWSRGIPSFDFGEKYIGLDRLHLQVFQSFDYRVSDILDAALDFVKIEARDEIANGYEIRAKYGKEVKIYVKYKNPDFYLQPSVRMIGSTLSLDNISIEADPSVDGQYVLTIFKSSFETQGTYTFSSNPISFTCVVESADEQQGVVRWGASTNRVLTYGQQVPQITAEGKGSYDFDFWEMFTGTEQNGEVVWSENADENFSKSDFVGQKSISTTQNGQFAFGTTVPFTTHFKLVAHFSQDSAVKFSIKSDDFVNKITIDGELYTGDDVLLSPKATTEIMVTVKNGYVLNTEKLLSDIKGLYGDNSTSTVYTDDPIKDDEGTTYKIKLSLQAISIENKTLSIRFSTLRQNSDSGKNLLWLWILIPCVVVLAGGIILAVFLIRRNRIYGELSKNGGSVNKQSKQKREKKVDYKDYYY